MTREQLDCFVKAIENLILEEDRHPDPPSAHHIPHDLARLFLQAAKPFLNGDVGSLDRTLGLVPPPGHPIDPDKSKNLDLAESALRLRMQGRTWTEVNNDVFADREKPPDERYIRTIVGRYKLVIMHKWREELYRRWVADSEVRAKRSIQKNEGKGKSRTPNCG